ncbi:hypothetical protein H4F99_12535 [Lysobacter sp. SG-8]|uniref:TniQ family protein n=1 Tax=Marilutibacter penaei TaxID=2759900 RepID=A0A7W3U5F9_9GAMM|nr:hypothetical protein [Lysobacter penaei]MBB1089306.1 hypothetical protein [Lysobacter penaei]
MNANDDPDRMQLEQLIGFGTLRRPLESWYAFVSRLIRANLLNDIDIRNQLPSDWVRWAFAPYDVQTSDLAVPGPYIEELTDLQLKLRPVAWQPFPELSSTPHECLRGCPKCLQAGYHSYALQGDLIARCPVHNEALVHRCPHCDTQLLWQARSPGLSAFHCPAGCLLLEGIHCGLHVPHEGQITVALQEHCAWNQAVRQAVEFVSGPVHIAYPPYLGVAPLRMPPLPSKGLLPALLHVLQDTGLALPAFAPYHEQSHGRWTLTVQPWVRSSAEICNDDQVEGYRRAFRRGAYRTHVPLVNRVTFEHWLVASESVHGRWHGGVVEEGSLCATFVLPSYLVTNNELTGLRRLLARGGDPRLACAHYQQVLIELFEHARLRRIALDALEEPSPHVTVAETFEAIVRTTTGYWRVTGRTRGDDESRSNWRDFREPAEMANGIIHVTHRNGPY